MPVRIDLKSPGLFGNEAAEDEDEEVFRSNLLRRADLADFNEPFSSIRIVSAYKGEGKSSLLRALANSVSKKDDCLVVQTTGPGAAPDVASPDTVKWARAWKKSLYSLIAARVGTEIGLAWNDDSVSLVESAEKQGFRRKSLISMITDRLQTSVTIGGPGAHFSFAKGDASDRDYEKILARFSNDKIKYIWVIVDDIDRNYKNTKLDKARIAGFFDAVRDMRNAIPQLRVRTSIRPNVYSSVRLEYESFSHVRQYIAKLSWSDVQIRQMLALRVEGYLRRTNQMEEVDLPTHGPDRDNKLISLVFDSPVKWGSGDATRQVYIPLYTLSAHRPRWVIELCKLAASRRHAQGEKITIDDIQAVMPGFGDSRKADISAEFKPGCPQADELIDAFYGEKNVLSTDEVVNIIETKILSSFTPNIAGMSDKPRAADVASFLFEMGIFFAREELDDGTYKHISFAENPSLLRSRVGQRECLRWEIHPVFRQVLRTKQG